MRRWLAYLPLAVLLAVPPIVHAHLMPVGQGGMRIVGDSVNSLVSLPVAVLRDVDDDGNGRLSLDELNAHRAGIEAQLAPRFRLFNGETEGRTLFQDLLIPDVENQGKAGTTHLILMRRSQWPGPVIDLRAHVDLFTGNGPDSALSLRAVNGSETDLAVMSAHRTEHRFFRGAAATLGNAIRTGAEHILLGYDHLLFLLTILVAGAGWRYWLSIITSFTVAHGTTLMLATYGVVSAPAAVIEPLIAASIVLFALDNLLRRQQPGQHRILLVFGCGLLHGLGIASALADIGLSERNRLWSLLGLNLGVELGQLVFIACLLAVLHAIRLGTSDCWHARLVRLSSVVAATIGTAWMVERLFGLM